MRDHYERIQVDFDRTDRAERLKYGLGRKIGERAELLSRMKEARDDKMRTEQENRSNLNEVNERKRRADERLFAPAVKGAQVDGEEESTRRTESDNTPHTKKKRSELST